MSIFKRETLWCSEAEDLALKIKHTIESGGYYKDVPELTQRQLDMVQEVTNIELEEYTIYRDTDGTQGTNVVWRVVALMLIIAQLLIIPALCVKWVFTGKYSLSSKSKFGIFYDKILRNGGFY